MTAGSGRHHLNTQGTSTHKHSDFIMAPLSKLRHAIPTQCIQMTCKHTHNNVFNVSNCCVKLCICFRNSTNKPFIDIRLCPGIATPLSPYDPLRQNVTLSITLQVQYITHHNAARGGLSHGHRGSAHQIWYRSVKWLQRYARRQTDAQTDGLITILCTPTGAQ